MRTYYPRARGVPPPPPLPPHSVDFYYYGFVAKFKKFLEIVIQYRCHNVIKSHCDVVIQYR